MKSLMLKLFLVLLATVGAVVVLMLVLMRWSFDRGFMGYLEEVQRASMEEVALRLEAYYARQGNWDEIRPGSEVWLRMTRPQEELDAQMAQSPEGQPPPPYPQPDFEPQGPREWGRAPSGWQPPFGEPPFPPAYGKAAPAPGGEAGYAPPGYGEPNPPSGGMQPYPPARGAPAGRQDMGQAPLWPGGDVPPPQRRDGFGAPNGAMPGVPNGAGLMANRGIAHPLDIGPRLSLFLPDGRHIIGRNPKLDGQIQRPILVNGVTVGVLGLKTIGEPLDLQDAQFLQQQRRDFYGIALLVVMLAGFAAWLLARRLLRPVHAIAGGARQLAAGDYETRVTVAGRDELHRLAEDFNALAETLQANESARRRWIADISHELRTPIAVLRGEIEALQDGVRAANDSTIDSLHGEAVHLGKLVEDLYQLAIADQGALTYQKQPTDVVELLGRLLDSAEQRLAEAGLTLERPDDDTPVMVWADPNRLTQLVHNLVTNTIRYTDRGGRMVFAWRVEGERFVLDVQDTTPGVPEEALPRLFDRLYRVEASRNRARGGAGLGLSIVKAIIEAHHGMVEARHSPLGGLWLHMELPIHDA